jgi:hypothetical protein
MKHSLFYRIGSQFIYYFKIEFIYAKNIFRLLKYIVFCFFSFNNIFIVNKYGIIGNFTLKFLEKFSFKFLVEKKKYI